MKDARRHAAATVRNRDPILSILQSFIPEDSLVLEIASGTGEHGLYFADRLPSVLWQPSDMDPAAIASIRAWRSDARVPRLLAPLQINVQTANWWLAVSSDLTHSLQTVVAINMIHISPWSAAEGLFLGASQLLPEGGFLYLYGPYRRQGVHTSDSNVQFDQSLRRQNAQWGVRNLEDVTALGQQHGFKLTRVWNMPANNLSVQFARF